MRSRCLSTTNNDYRHYGGRGIRICKRWDVFENFLADMGNRPPETTLDRINNDGDYTPSNCRWATRKQQCGNKRMCIYVEHKTERVTLKEYARRVGRPYNTLLSRIQRYGWSIEEALL